MKKAESPSEGMVGVSAASDIKNKSFITELKSLIKIGIVNSNLLTVFTGIWLALYFTGASFGTNWDIFLFTRPEVHLSLLEVALLITGMMQALIQ